MKKQVLFAGASALACSLLAMSAAASDADVSYFKIMTCQTVADTSGAGMKLVEMSLYSSGFLKKPFADQQGNGALPSAVTKMPGLFSSKIRSDGGLGPMGFEVAAPLMLQSQGDALFFDLTGTEEQPQNVSISMKAYWDAVIHNNGTIHISIPASPGTIEMDCKPAIEVSSSTIGFFEALGRMGQVESSPGAQKQAPVEHLAAQPSPAPAAPPTDGHSQIPAR